MLAWRLRLQPRAGKSAFAFSFHFMPFTLNFSWCQNWLRQILPKMSKYEKVTNFYGSHVHTVVWVCVQHKQDKFTDNNGEYNLNSRSSWSYSFVQRCKYRMHTNTKAKILECSKPHMHECTYIYILPYVRKKQRRCLTFRRIHFTSCVRETTLVHEHARAVIPYVSTACWCLNVFYSNHACTHTLTSRLATRV